MELAGSFRYIPAFQLDESSTEQLLALDQISEITGESEVCQTIADFRFEDTDARVVYGEIGDSSGTAKFFLNLVFEDSSDVPKDVKVYVPQDQENYPTSRQFWSGQREENEGKEAEMAERVRNIAKNFKHGEVIIIDEKEDG